VLEAPLPARRPHPQVLRAHIEAIFSSELLPDLATGRACRRLPGLTGALPPAAAALDRRQWAALVAALPERDAPSTFGLPANIDRAATAAAAASALSALQRVGLAADGTALGSDSCGGGSGFERAGWAARLGPLMDLWEGLLAAAPPGVRAAAAAAAAEGRTTGATAAAGGGSPVAANRAGGPAGVGAAADCAGPLETFVALEQSLAVALVRAVSGSLAALRRALVGTAAPTPEVQVRPVGGKVHAASAPNACLPMIPHKRDIDLDTIDPPPPPMPAPLPAPGLRRRPAGRHRAPGLGPAMGWPRGPLRLLPRRAGARRCARGLLGAPLPGTRPEPPPGARRPGGSGDRCGAAAGAAGAGPAVPARGLP
jgi:hypothetical protein